MRGGAIPLLIWSALIGALFVIHLLMTGAAVGDPVDTGIYGFGIGVILVGVAAIVAERRETLHRGAPEPDSDPAAVPAASLGALLMALAFVACGFGLVFGSFLVFIAAGVFAGAVFVLTREVGDERRARRAWSQKGRAG